MADLKRDIKKLQRFREDIMKWFNNPEVKDKNALADSRRRIEVEMEKFKAFERESKTKPFSLMGLAMGGKLDAQEQKKQEKREALEEFVDKLTVQSDEFRAEWETLTAKKKKNKDESHRMDELKKFIDRHAFHLRSLEQVLRRLDNDMIDPDELDNLIDSLEIYVEQFEDPDYYHDEGLYEQYNLDSDAVDETYYKPSLDETEESKNAASSSASQAEQPKIREVPLTAAAKAKAKKQAAREFEAAQTGGPVRPDHPAQVPPKPTRPSTPTVTPPSLPSAPAPPSRPPPVYPGMSVSSQAPVMILKSTGVWKASDLAPPPSERPPPPPPPAGISKVGDRLTFLENSCRSRPRCDDLIRTRPYRPSNPFSVADNTLSYPDRLLNTEDSEFIKKLPIDSLILIFYYREGTHAQFLASQELKRQNWRFHKKFGIWFKRTEGGIKTINPAFEYGAYDFFDMSGESWGIKTRSDFTFEYEYLEDESLPSDANQNPNLVIRRPPPPTTA
jgi:CCR4-NOT transcription complex subunit 3